MVNVSGVIELGKLQTGVLGVDHAILFPVRWFQEHFVLNNLLVTSPLVKLLDNSKQSHRMIGDYLLDLQSFNHATWAPYRYLYIDLDTKEIKGISMRDKLPGGMLRINFPKAKEPVSLYLTTPYRFASNEVLLNDGVKANVELKYNKVMWDYFKSKYPIKLKSFNPISGESGYVKVAAPSNARRV